MVLEQRVQVPVQAPERVRELELRFWVLVLGHPLLGRELGPARA